MEDSMILDLFFIRDETAIRETDLKYGKKLTSISMGILENIPDVEECINDTYLAVWNEIPPTRPDNYYAFLCRIVRNISHNRFHKNTAAKRNAPVISLEAELSEILPDGEGSPADEIALAQAIDSFLRQLDKKSRLLFIRRYFYADSLAMLSALTHIGEGALGMRLMRIRKKLREHLEKEGYRI